MKNFKKLTCMLVSLLAVSVLFAGCNSDEAASGSAGSAASAASSAPSASEAETTEAPVEEMTTPAVSAEESVVEESAVEAPATEVIICDDMDTYLIESSKAVHEATEAGLAGDTRLLIKADNSDLTFDQYNATKVVIDTTQNEYTVQFANAEDAAAAMEAVSQMDGIDYVETDGAMSIAD